MVQLAQMQALVEAIHHDLVRPREDGRLQLLLFRPVRADRGDVDAGREPVRAHDGRA